MGADATLVIHNGKEFENKLWNATASFSEEAWKISIQSMIDSCKYIYQRMDDDDSFHQYILGDVINLLSNIDIKLEGADDSYN